MYELPLIRAPQNFQCDKSSERKREISAFQQERILLKFFCLRRL